MTVQAEPRPAGAVLRVVRIDPLVDPRWAAFVAAHPEGTIYHHPAWLRALAAEYGQPAAHLACEDAEGRLRGILPLLQTRGLPLRTGGLLAGRRLASLPRTPVAGPLALDREATAALVGAAVARARRTPGLRLQLKGQAPDLDGLVDGLVGVPWRLTYVLELPVQPDELRFGNSRNHAQIKWAVNKAAKSGVRVRPADTVADLRAWYALYLDTMRWHAVPPRPYRFFRALWDLLQSAGQLRLLLAERDEARRPQLLAGALFLLYGQTVSYGFGGRRREALALRPNDAIHWRAIEEAYRAGFRRYDFGEVPEGHEGLAAFKGKWGTEPRRLYRYYHPCPVTPAVERTTAPGEGAARRLARAAWRRLALPATAQVGDWLYRYL